MPAFLEFSPAVFESVRTEESAYADDSLQVNKSRVPVARHVDSLTGRWSNHKSFLASALDNHQEKGIHRIEDVKNTEGTLRNVKRLLHDWVAAQAAVVSCDGTEKYVPVSGATIIHLRPPQQPARRKDPESRGGGHRASKSFAKQDQNDMLFLIGFQSHSSNVLPPTLGMSNSYILLQKQMFSDEEAHSGKEAPGKIFGDRVGLPVKVGSYETIYCRRLTNCYESSAPALLSLRWLGDALEKAFFREFVFLSPPRFIFLHSSYIRLEMYQVCVGWVIYGRTCFLNCRSEIAAITYHSEE